MTAAAPAALVIARAPADPAALPGLAPRLGAGRAAVLQALLIARAADWAAAAAPGAASVAVLPREGVRAASGAEPAGAAMAARRAESPEGAGDGAEHAGAADRGDDDLRAVASLLPAGVAAFAAVDLEDAIGRVGHGPLLVAGTGCPRLGAQHAEDAIGRVGHGPLLVAGTGCPRLGAQHAATALDDLRAGCDFVFGSTLDGGWYLAGLGAPRAELLSIAALRRGGIGDVLGRARELGVEVGLLRRERAVATPGDAAALIADPLVDDALRAALSA